ncbi:hypothetical protein GCM10009564_54930 [Streptomyces thermogriseus]|uniref:Lipoprotein n=2 Tax=Streptomyces thermogriseus TaxID=75292 RepID=A0ABP4DTI7_9ACTN
MHTPMTLSRWLSVGAICLLLTTGCSTGADSDQSGVSAEQVCDSSLDKTAAAALRRLGGTDRFEELTGTTDAGEPNAFSLKRAAQHLHDETPLRSRCTVYKAGDKSGSPLIQIDFKVADDYPKRQQNSTQNNDRIYYDIGLYASTQGDYSTVIYFRCSTTDQGKSSAYVDAGMFTTSTHLKGRSTSVDRMTILNTVSRKLAAELGCSSEAGLPSSIPKPEAP